MLFDINLHGLNNKAAAQTVLSEMAAKYPNRPVTRRLQFELASVQSHAGSGKTELQAFEQDREDVSEAERVQERDEIQLSAYPNPFNPETTIQYQLPEHSRVTLRIYNLLGEEIRKLVDEVQHSVRWDGKDRNGVEVASGVYVSRLQVGKSVEARKMLLVR